jgi:hypothetical protein
VLCRAVPCRAVLSCRVRHEAAEALGAIAAPDCLEVLQQHTTDSCQEVAETCQLALGRLQYLQQKQEAGAAAAAEGSKDTPAAAAAGAGEEESPYYSVDPTPALPSSTPIEQLRSILLDPQQPMFEVGVGLSVGSAQRPVDSTAQQKHSTTGNTTRRQARIPEIVADQADLGHQKPRYILGKQCDTAATMPYACLLHSCRFTASALR